MEIHRQLLSVYRQQHNQLIPISRLLPELLADIFRIALVEASEKSLNSWFKAMGAEFWSYHNGAYGSSRVAIKLSHVCRHWRTVAKNDPCLWTEIWMTCQRWCWRMLERSKGAPLVIRAHFPPIFLHDPTVNESARILSYDRHMPHFYTLNESKIYALAFQAILRSPRCSHCFRSPLQLFDLSVYTSMTTESLMHHPSHCQTHFWVAYVHRSQYSL